MAKVEISTVGDEIYYGMIQMPHYQGVQGSICRLTRDWRIGLMLPDGRIFDITIKANFSFDGASVPRALWRVCGHPLETPRIAAALVHDWLYAAHITTRAEADLVYREILRAVGVSCVRRWTEYVTLRAAGEAAWRSHGAADEQFALAHGVLAIDGQSQKGKNNE